MSERASDSRSEAQAPAVRQWLSSVCSFLSLLFIFFRFCLQTFLVLGRAILNFYFYFSIFPPQHFQERGSEAHEATRKPICWRKIELERAFIRIHLLAFHISSFNVGSYFQWELIRPRNRPMSFLAKTSSSWMTDPCKSMNHDS